MLYLLADEIIFGLSLNEKKMNRVNPGKHAKAVSCTPVLHIKLLISGTVILKIYYCTSIDPFFKSVADKRIDTTKEASLVSTQTYR